MNAFEGTSKGRNCGSVVSIDQDLFEEKEVSPLIRLGKGGLLIKTKAGNIQYGIPPETVKDSLSIGEQVPEYFIVPQERFNWTDGITLMEFEFPMFFNFFIKKQQRTKLICDAETVKNIKEIFQETLLGPKTFPDFLEEFNEGYLSVPDIVKELAYFAKNPFKPSEVLSLEHFIEFILLDETGKTSFSKKITENGIQTEVILKVDLSSDLCRLEEDGRLLAEFNAEVELRRENYFMFKSIPEVPGEAFTPPAFGITMLGNSHGFDCCGSTSGLIIWINQKGIMVDPPPYSSKALREQGISPNLIEKIIITHCHADHDSGAFHKIIEASSVEFLSTSTILNSFLRKYAATSRLPVKSLKRLFHHRHVIIGHPINIFGANFTFEYTFHSLPALCFSVEYQGKKMFFSGDTFYHPTKLRELYEQGLFSKERFESLAIKDWSQYDAIFHEAGIPPIHTPASVFLELPMSIQKKIYLYHIAGKDVPQGTGLKTAKVGLENTVVLLESSPVVDKVSEILELLCSMEIVKFVPFRRILEFIHCFRERIYEKGQTIIKAGSHGNTFYIIKKGRCRVYSDSSETKESFSKTLISGDFFGESVVMGNSKRLANVKAETNVSLLEIGRNDFKWIFSFHQDPEIGDLSPLEMMKNLSSIRKAKLSEFINNNRVISKMVENQKCFLNMFLKPLSVKQSTYLWRKGEKASLCFILREGKFLLRLDHPIQNEKLISEPGILVGDFPSLCEEDKLASSDILCEEDANVLIVERQYLRIFLKLFPGVFILCQDKFVLH